MVGCDLEIGSGKKVDECGVCGGDGTSCVQPLYYWAEAPVSLCSMSCGGGKFCQQLLNCAVNTYYVDFMNEEQK